MTKRRGLGCSAGLLVALMVLLMAGIFLLSIFEDMQKEDDTPVALSAVRYGIASV